MAKVLSSISGNLISAASAGFAPTNSADVSAIASAYQVVSATATQLYAGTAYVTSINSAPISASRAGNAANASMANSAYYDGTGRLISSLPDSAAVSSIASSYAPTFGLNDGKISSINGSALDAATGAQVVTAIGSSLQDIHHVPTTVISSINGSSLYAVGSYEVLQESSRWNKVSAKQDTSAMSSYALSADVSGTISAVSVNSAKWRSTNTTVLANSANWNSVYNTVNLNSANWSGSTGGGGEVSSPSGTIVVNGSDIEGTNSAVLTATAAGFTSTGYLDIPTIPDWGMVRLITDVLPDTGGVLRLSADNPIFSADILLSGQDLASNFVTATATVTGNTRDIAIPLGAMAVNISASASQYLNMAGDDVYTAEKAGGIQVTGIGELAWKSAVDNVTNTVSSNSATWGQGGVDSATVSSIASSYAQSAVSGVESTVSANSASWGGGATGDYVEKSALEVTIGTANTASHTAFVQGSSNSASGASFAQGRLNTADTNSFAQGYNNSAVFYSFVQGSQNKALYTSFAQGNANIASAISFACGEGVWAINTAAAFGHYNRSYDGDTATGHSAAFVIGDGPMYDQRHDLMLVTKDGEITMYSSTADTTGTGIMSAIRAISAAATGGVDSATVSAIASGYAESAVSSKADSSALSSYALSADVSSTVDVVSTQSANWGGSALALSAGKGVKLELSGSTLVASTDETVLWSGSSYIGSGGYVSVPLSEAAEHFEAIKISFARHSAWVGNKVLEFNPSTSTKYLASMDCYDENGANMYCYFGTFTLSGSYYTELNGKCGYYQTINGTAPGSNVVKSNSLLHPYKIIGINRTAGV